MERLQDALGAEQRLRRQAAIAHAEERDALRAEASRLAAEGSHGRARAGSTSRRRSARGKERTKVGIVLSGGGVEGAPRYEESMTPMGNQARWLMQQEEQAGEPSTSPPGAHPPHPYAARPRTHSVPAIALPATVDGSPPGGGKAGEGLGPRSPSMSSIIFRRKW